jgi:hypothetical protein
MRGEVSAMNNETLNNEVNLAEALEEVLANLTPDNNNSLENPVETALRSISW